MQGNVEAGIVAIRPCLVKRSA